MSDGLERIRQLEKELDLVFWNLLIPLRDEKRVDGSLFDRFLENLDELVALVQGRPEVRKRIVSFLYLVYEVLLAESKQSTRPGEIQKEARRLQERLEKLWDSI